LKFESSRARFSLRRLSVAHLFSLAKIISMAGQGSTGNVIAALCSFFIPGLGQLLQGRLLMAIVQFCLAAVLWIVLLGWLIHLWSILDAALYKPRP
jgi:TM2 domain-containing membrane protein YozV